MLLGRNTQQWLAGIGVVLAIASQYVSPAASGSAFGVEFHVTTVIAALAALDAALIAWIAQTSTTPISSPRLETGTQVTVTTADGDPIHTTTV